MSHVLVVDDERGIREGLATALNRSGLRAVTAQGLSEARTRLAETTIFSCILLDIRLRDGDGLDFLRELRQGAFRDVPVIVATAYDDGPRTIAAMRDGAFDYITKPFDLPRLLSTVMRAVGTTKNTKSAPLELLANDEALVGKTPAMHEIWKLIGRASATAVPVLVRGEAGTGKELVARAIHTHSSRASGPLVVLRANATSGDLGAQICAADPNSTVLLDGVGLLDGPAQARLAAALAKGTHARVIATTCDPGSVLDGRGLPAARILPELYCHLAVVEVTVPPLRERRADIPLLAARALGGGPSRAFADDALLALTTRDYPGNVRELFLVVRRAAAMATSGTITVHDLPDDVSELGGASFPRSEGPSSYEGLPLKDAIARLEKELLTRALHRAEGNRTAAARILGIARPQLYVKLEEHRIVDRRKS